MEQFCVLAIVETSENFSLATTHNTVSQNISTGYFPGFSRFFLDNQLTLVTHIFAV
jgi:hypothetical protein